MSTRYLTAVAAAACIALILGAQTVSADPVRCKREIAKRSGKLVELRLRLLAKCEDRALRDGAVSACPDSKTAAKLAKASARLTSSVARRCGGDDRSCDGSGDVELADIGWDIGSCPDYIGGDCSNALSTCADVSACMACIAEAVADQAASLYYSASPSGDASVLACQRAIGKEATKLHRGRLKTLLRCDDRVLQGRSAGCPDEKTLPRIAKLEARRERNICRACGGADRACGGGDDLGAATIGFPSGCPDLAVPAVRRFCGRPVDTLEDILSCLDCTTDTQTACADAAATPSLRAYPRECAGGQCPDYSPVMNVHFGDTHVHTRYSLDASTQGTLMTPAEAYAFARGVLTPIQPFDAQGVPLRHLQLVRPLDFTVVSDHAEFFGEVTICEDPSHPNYNSNECQIFRNNPDQAFILFNAQLAEPGAPDGMGGKQVARFPGVCGPDGGDCREAAKTPWGIIQDDTNAAYDPCNFTTLVGYEWTGSPESSNLHRNVFFANENVPEIPTSYFEAPDPELLWAGLEEDCHQNTPGCRSTTVPHNSNVSTGLMFKTTDGNDLPFTPAYAAMRQRFEPLVEIFQHKGDSECYVLSGPGAQDELCGFEKFPYNNLIFDRFGGAGSGPPEEVDFVRDALKVGMQLEQSLGTNPFKYGIIASSDTHLGAPASVVEKDFPGHGGAGSSTQGELPTGLPDNIAFNPGGLAVLWAEENTREAIYDSIERRETYGTSGPRITLRFFGGSDYEASICDDPGAFAADGYAGGVPMGSDLEVPVGFAPRFALLAVKDPGAVAPPRVFPYHEEPSTPLQKAQIIKGWIDAGGQKQEAVYDVVGGNDAAVDEATCDPIAPSVGINHDTLCAVWEDPDFDPTLSAFYYVRVVENPTCRWSTIQCNAAGVDCDDPPTVTEGFDGCCDPEYPATVQERAWSSPIWYRPPAS